MQLKKKKTSDSLRFVKLHTHVGQHYELKIRLTGNNKNNSN